MVSSRGGLSIAELIFYIPALPIAAYVAYRHGFGRSSGWVFLVILAVVRIVGAILELVSESDANSYVQSWAYILQNVGFSPLLLALLGILQRIQEEMTEKALRPRMFRILGIIPVVALILSIVGGTKLQSGHPDAATLDDAETFDKVAAILFLVTFIFCVMIIALTGLKFRLIPKTDKGLYFAAALSLPFLLVRVIYLMLVSFNIENPSSMFSFIAGNVYIQAFMSGFEEFVVVIMYLSAGFMTEANAAHQRRRNPPKIEQIPSQPGASPDGYNMDSFHNRNQTSRSQQSQFQQPGLERGEGARY